jgi:hypothetical protein
MICAKHDWWLSSVPCPKCVTAAETTSADEPLPHAVESPTGAGGGRRDGEMPDIPDFLKRNKDGSFTCPRTSGPSAASLTTAPTCNVTTPGAPMDVTSVSETDLMDMLNSPEMTLVERQPIYQELRAREDKKKSYGRLDKMKAKKEAGKETL